MPERIQDIGIWARQDMRFANLGLIKAALATARRAAEKHGKQSERMSDAYETLAARLQGIGRLRMAKAFAQQAVVLQIACRGKSDVYVAGRRIFYGNILKELGEYSEARREYEGAEYAYSRSIGETAKDTQKARDLLKSLPT